MNGLQKDVICEACPLQIEGTIDGMAFDFRARGRHWTMGIGGEPADEPLWHLSGPWGNGPFAAGCMPEQSGAPLWRNAVSYGASLAIPRSAREEKTTSSRANGLRARSLAMGWCARTSTAASEISVPVARRFSGGIRSRNGNIARSPSTSTIACGTTLIDYPGHM